MLLNAAMFKIKYLQLYSGIYNLYTYVCMYCVAGFLHEDCNLSHDLIHEIKIYEVFTRCIL